MTRIIYILQAVASLSLVGCTTPLTEKEFDFLVTQAPLVPCNELMPEGATDRWKQQPFTGRTVWYKWGYELALYQRGQRVERDRLPSFWLTDWMPDEEAQPECYQAAFHEYAESDWGFSHDDYIVFCREGFGKIEDVPKLIKGLEYWGDIIPDKPVACSRSHCIDALKFVTGAYPGPNASDWKKWWEEYKANEKE